VLFLIRVTLYSLLGLGSGGFLAQILTAFWDLWWETVGLTVTVVVYFSARCRQENLDLELLLAAVDPPEQPAEVAL